MIRPETLLIEKSSSQPLDTDKNGSNHPQSLQDEKTINSSLNLNPEESKIDSEAPKESKENKQQSNHQAHPFTLNKANSIISFKKFSSLSRPKDRIGLVCYIPERNLLLALLSDCTTINIYNTLNFKLLAIRKSQGMILCMTYSQHLQKILVGGYNSLLHIWCPKTLKLEKESPKIRYQSFYSIAYIPESNIIITKSSNQFSVYDPELVLMKDYSLPIYGEERAPGPGVFHSLSKEILLVTSRFRKRKRLFLLNLQKETLEECTQLFIPQTSCVEMIESDENIKVFSCLIADETDAAKLSQIDEEVYPFTLALFAIDTKTGEFTVFKKTSYAFNKLCRVENSQYFIAQKPSHEVFLLSIKKDSVDIVNVIPTPSAMFLDRHSTFVMIKGGAFLVEKNSRSLVSVYRCGYEDQSEKDSEKKEY